MLSRFILELTATLLQMQTKTKGSSSYLAWGGGCGKCFHADNHTLKKKSLKFTMWRLCVTGTWDSVLKWSYLTRKYTFVLGGKKVGKKKGFFHFFNVNMFFHLYKARVWWSNRSLWALHNNIVEYCSPLEKLLHIVRI